MSKTKGLDFEKAHREVWGKFYNGLSAEDIRVNEILQAQHAALLAAAVAEERAKVAPLVKEVREWREAFHAYRREVALPADETDDGATERFTAAHWRLRKAGKALAALPLPDAP